MTDMTAPFRPSPGLRGLYMFYQLLWHVALPFALVYFALLSRREPGYRRRLWQRLGFGRAARPGAVWVNAVSIGEMRAVTPLVRRLLDAGHDVVLTHATPDGWRGGRQFFGPEIGTGQVRQAWVPLDVFWAVGLFLRRFRPRLGLMVEGEIWPGQVLTAHRLGVPLVIVNGNLSARRCAKDAGWWLGRQRQRLYTGFVLALTKSPGHVARYVASGLDPERVIEVGELKADIPVRADQVAAAAPVRAALLRDRPGVLLLASAVEAEVPDLLGVVRLLRDRITQPPAVVWVPRDAQGFDTLAARLAAEGLDPCRRSQVLDDRLRPRGPLTGLMLGDSLGEMDFYYQLADVVFVGATLNDEGGHNITEPLAHERPVVTGPSLWGIAASAPPAQAAGVLRVFPDAPALAEELVRMFTDATEREGFAALTQGYHAGQGGAAARSMAALAPWLDAG